MGVRKRRYPEAGGPRFYLSDQLYSTKEALAAALPAILDTGLGISLGGTSEVQLVTIGGSPTGGTFTLSFEGEETGNLAYNISLALLQAALDGLDAIGPGNTVVTGTPGSAYTVTFAGELAAMNCPALVADDDGLTGGSSPSVTVTTPTPGVLPGWSDLPLVTEKSTVKFVEKSEDIEPLHKMWRTMDVVIARGIEEINLNYAQRDVEALMFNLATATDEWTDAASHQTGLRKMYFGSAPSVGDYRHLIGMSRNAFGYITVDVFCKVKVTGDFTYEWDHKLTKIPAAFKVFAHELFDETKDVMWRYQVEAPSTD